MLFWLALYVILRTQGVHPFNPEGFDSATWDVTFNTTSSFISNTNWQYYGGETTLSYFSQMAGLAVQNFVSAAVGMAVLAAVIRGFASRGTANLGNFWQDLTRTLFYILLPLSFVGALVLVSQGVIQTLSGYVSYSTVQGLDQTLALGPAASQIAIKQLGTNGGGFFNVNSSMPFENATRLLELRRGAVHPAHPAALTCTFGAHGRATAARAGPCTRAMAVMLVAAVARRVRRRAERLAGPEVRRGRRRRPRTARPAATSRARSSASASPNSALWATATTDASNGSVNSAHDSYTGIGGTVPLANMMTGEVIFGGVGSGLYGMLLMVILAVFIAGPDGGPDARVPRQEDRGA